MRTKAFAAVLLVAVALVAFSATRDTPVREALLAKPTPAEAALDRVLPEVLIDGLPFDEAVARLQAVAKVRLIVDWPVLHELAIDRRAPVHLQMRGVRLSDALQRALTQVSYGRSPEPLDFAPDGEAVLVTAANRLYRRQYTRCYDIRDLLPRPDASLPAPDPDPALNVPAAGPCLDGGLFAGRPEREEYRIVDFITSTVAPDTWRDNGGSLGIVRYTAGRLLIVQNWDNHCQIERILGMLRHPVASGPRPAEWLAWDARVQQWVSGSPDLAQQSLRAVLPEVRIENATLDEAVRSLARLARANLVLDMKTLEEAELDRKHLRDAGVEMSDGRRRTIHLHDVTLEAALEAVVREYSDSVWKGAFTVDEGVVVVTTEAAAFRTFPRIYDLRDWPHVGAAAEASKRLDAAASTRVRELDELLQAITTTVAPESWSGNGGAGQIVCVADRMVVTQTWRKHEEVRRFMAALPAGPPPPAGDDTSPRQR